VRLGEVLDRYVVTKLDSQAHPFRQPVVGSDTKVDGVTVAASESQRIAAAQERREPDDRRDKGPVGLQNVI
jgi:hypothetical protein